MRGFTLIELIVVLVILGLASALIVPRIGHSELSLLKADMREIISVLNYSRRTAVVRGIPMEAQFFPPAPPNEAGAESANQPLFEKKIGTWVSKGASLRWGDASEWAETEASQGKTITFYPEGSSSGGELVLQRKAFIAKINVDPITGKISAKLEE